MDIASITINIVNFVIKRTDFANNVQLPNNTSIKLQLLQQAILSRKYFNISRLFSKLNDTRTFSLCRLKQFRFKKL